MFFSYIISRKPFPLLDNFFLFILLPFKPKFLPLKFYSGSNQNKFDLRKTLKKEISKSNLFQRKRSFNGSHKNNYAVKTMNFNVAENRQVYFVQKYLNVNNKLF